MKKSILAIYALAVCFVALVCFVIALGIGVYDLIQIANPVFTINAYEYDRHQSKALFMTVWCPDSRSVESNCGIPRG